jgi:hypothetical protein
MAVLLALALIPALASPALGAPAGAECEVQPPPEGCPTRTSMLLISSPNPSTQGQTVTYTASVAPIPDGGTVAFAELGTPIPGCEAVAVNSSHGSAACPVAYASAGVHTVQAAYSGDATFKPSQSEYISQLVEAAPVAFKATATAVAIAASANPSRAGGAVTYTATITPAPPGGTVEFTDSQVSVPQCRAVDLLPVGTQAATATCRVPYESPGRHLMRAVYSGAGSFSGAESSLLEESVNGSSEALLAQLSHARATRGGKVAVRMACISFAGVCKVSATLTSRVSYRHGKAVGVNALARPRNVTIGARHASVSSGKSASLTIGLNAGGRRLLARFHALPATLRVSVESAGQRTALGARRLTIKP